MMLNLPVLKLFLIRERRNTKSRDGGADHWQKDPFNGGLVTRTKELETTFRGDRSRLMISILIICML